MWRYLMCPMCRSLRVKWLFIFVCESRSRGGYSKLLGGGQGTAMMYLDGIYIGEQGVCSVCLSVGREEQRSVPSNVHETTAFKIDVK